MIEVEKKYRVDADLFERLNNRLSELALDGDEVSYIDQEVEENILYSASFLDPKKVLRIRTAHSTSVGMYQDTLTYKSPISNEDGLKQQLEIETTVKAYLLKQIFKELGLKPSLIYEKKRETWGWDLSLVCMDILPFGYFVEIEGATAESIKEIEEALGLSEYVEPKSYPTLTRELGKDNNGVIEARF